MRSKHFFFEKKKQKTFIIGTDVNNQKFFGSSVVRVVRLRHDQKRTYFLSSASNVAGFTLLELLIALVVLGVLLAGLGQATQFGLLAATRQTNMIERSADLDAVDRLLRHVVAQIDPGDQHDAPVLAGTPSSLQFTSELPSSVALANHHAEMRLLVDAGHRLVLRWAPALHAIRIGPPPTPDNTVLLTGVDHLELAYWPRPETPGTGWRDRWDAPQPPALVRIRIVFVRGDARRWPTIVAATMREKQ